jgi:hypothetical protein
MSLQQLVEELVLAQELEPVSAQELDLLLQERLAQ